MKCPFCAEEIQDKAIKCRFCGEFLTKSNEKPKKSPATAAVLNLLFWGAGYLYCGRTWGLAILIPFMFLTASAAALYEIPTPDFPSIIIVNLPGIAMAWHAYKMAETDNRKQKTSPIRIEEEIAITKDPEIRKQLQKLLDKKTKKSPGAAAVLNFFFWGAGYVYCGRQWGIFILIAIFVLVQIPLISGWSVSFLSITSRIQLILLFTIIGGLLAWDAYKITETDNWK